MITAANYFEKTPNIDFDTMPEAVRQGHAFVVDLTNNGNNWEDYHESDPIKETVDIYFKSIEKQLESKKGKTKNPPSAKTEKPAEKTPGAKLFIDERVNHHPDEEAKPVERVEEELKFIKRYASMHGKEKAPNQILSFINSLQKAILEKRIRKTSPHSEQIGYIQESLIKLYNKMTGPVEIKIRDTVLSEMLAIANSVKIRLSVAYLKRYIGMQGKLITKEKAEKLLAVVTKALDSEKIKVSDPYIEKMKRVLSSLRSYVKKAGENETLQLQEATLDGIHKALNDCACGKSLAGSEEPSTHEDESNRPDAKTVMNSMDFAQMQFDTLGFTGKWLELIGDPSSNFTAMIFGKPKMGKSYLAIDFAGYLARNFGRVLYVAKEEGLDLTLQEKLSQKNVQHFNLFVTSSLPNDLNRFAFICLDSVNRLGLTPEDLLKLRDQYPSKSFICIFQSTKQGNFRGANGFQHDVDVVIEVPEKGKAVQMGRFNQGGEIQIFEESNKIH